MSRKMEPEEEEANEYDGKGTPQQQQSSLLSLLTVRNSSCAPLDYLTISKQPQQQPQPPQNP